MAPNKEIWELLFGAGYIVPPCKGLEPAQVEARVVGSPVDIASLPIDYFLTLFSKEADDYPIDIVFSPENGRQENKVRTLVRAIALEDEKVKANNSLELAYCLARATTRRSKKPGLFVVLAGHTNDNHRVVLWKFPADESIQASVTKEGISIRLIHDAFSGNSTYLKVAMFDGIPATTSFWRGKIEDRQTKSRVREVADFWVVDFLQSRPAVTDAGGTRLLARVLRDTIRKTKDIEVKQSLVDAASVIKGQAGRNITLEDFADSYLPEDIRQNFIRVAGGPEISSDLFRIDRDVLDQELRYKSLSLDNQFIVRGPLEQFNDIVQIEDTDEEGVVEVSLRGRITSQEIFTK